MPTQFPTTGSQAGDIAAGLISPGGTYSPITPESMSNTNPLQITSPNPVATYPVSALNTTPELTPTPTDAKISGLTSSLQGLYSSLVGKSAYQTSQNTNFGVDHIQSTITDLNAQLNGLKNQASAIPLQMDQNIAKNGTILSSGYNTQQNTALRENAIAALGVSTLLAASQGQLANAQALADKAVSQKYDPILEQIAATTKNLELIKGDPNTTIEEKNQAQKQIDIMTQKKEDTTKAANNATEVWKVATEAAGQGATFKATPDHPTLATTLQQISSAKTKEEALQIAVKTNLVKPNTDASGQKIIGSASSGYYVVNADGTITKLTGGGNDNKTDYNSVVKNLQSQKIPSTSSNKDGSLNSKSAKSLYDAGISPDTVTWLWNAVKGGTSFDEIRQGITSGGGDPKILDTFVQTLQN